jgi:malonate transporter
MTAVLFTILPVFAVVLAGWAVARANLISSEGVAGFANVTFYLFVPALLFRAIRNIHFETLDAKPIYTYFSGALVCFFIVMLASRRWLDRDIRLGTVRGLAMVFSNTVLLGIPLVKLAFGDEGLVVLLMLISMHALILMSVATMILELGVGQAEPAAGAGRSHVMNIVDAVRNTVINPVILPIVAGLAYGALRWPLPDVIDAPLALLATASGPCSLVLLGASLAQYGIREYWRPAVVLTLLKNIAFPVLIWTLGRFVFGLDKLALAVVTVTAALPIGANVYLFAQRYNVAQGEVTASVAVSTAISVLTLAIAILLFS